MKDKYSLSIGVIGVAFFHLLLGPSFSQPPKKNNPEKKSDVVLKTALLKPKVSVDLRFHDDQIKPVLGTVFSGHVLYSHRVDTAKERGLGCIGKGLYLYSLEERSKAATDDAIKNYTLSEHNCISSILVIDKKVYMKGRAGADYATEQLYEIAALGKLGSDSKLSPVLPEILDPKNGSYHANLKRMLDLMGRNNPDLLAGMGPNARLRNVPYRTFLAVGTDKQIRVYSLLQLKNTHVVLQDSYPSEPKTQIVPNILKYENAEFATRFDGKSISELVVLDNGSRFIPIVDGDRNNMAVVVGYLPTNKNAEDFAFQTEANAKDDMERPVNTFSVRAPRFLTSTGDGIIGAETSILLSWDVPYVWYYDRKGRTVTKLPHIELGRKNFGGISLYENGLVVTEADNGVIKYYGETNPFENYEAENLEKKN